MQITIETDLTDEFDQAVDQITSEIKEAMENIRKYTRHDIPHSVTVDLYEELRKGFAIALIWDAEQVRSHYPHLTREQAWKVLQQCDCEYDAEQGLTWDDIAEAVAELYPDPEGFLVPERIARCEQALAPYTDSDEANLTDLLADLMHWGQRNDQSFVRALRTARMHFRHETPTRRRSR